MKFGQLLYSKDEEIAIIYSEHFIQHMATNLTGGVLSQGELTYLKKKARQQIINLIIKIDSSGIGNEKES